METIFKDPKFGLRRSTFIENAIKQGFNMKDAINYYNKNQLSQVHKHKNRDVKKFTPITSQYVKHMFQVDLIDMKNISRSNKGIYYILTVIDIYSRYAILEPIYRKTASIMKKAFENVFDRIGTPNVIITDNGLEFKNSKVRQLFKSKNIKHDMNEPGDHFKMGIIERFNKTIKELIYKYLDHISSNKYIDKLSDFEYNYNNTTHGSIKQRRIDVFKNNRN